MGVPTSEVGYTPAMPRRVDHKVHKGHVVALGGGTKKNIGIERELMLKFRVRLHTDKMIGY